MKIAMQAEQIDDYPWGGPIAVLIDPTAEQLGYVYLAGYGEVLAAAGSSEFELASTSAALWADEQAALLVKGIDEETRRSLQTLVSSALADPELSQVGLRDQILGMFDDMSVKRADLIARNEVALASNMGNLAGYRSFGGEYVEVSDGIGDDPCAVANGAIWTIAQAEADPLAHPNCSRSFSYLPTDQVDPSLVGATAI